MAWEVTASLASWSAAFTDLSLLFTVRVANLLTIYTPRQVHGILPFWKLSHILV